MIKNKKNSMLRVNLSLGVVMASSLFLSSVHASDNQLLEDGIQIVGGTETTPYSRPYQVALLMNGRQGCGGTLISPQWVLTAAHCLDSASTSNLTVKTGAHSLSRNDGTTHRVSQIIRHENWRGAQSITSGYDIAVLRLASPANSSIKPASIPSVSLANQIASIGQNLTVSGWGLTFPGGSSGSDVLREVDLPVMSNSSCSSQLGTNVGNGVICGDGPSNRSACNGDSGGPYAASYNGTYYSIGTVSWGRGCRGATAFTRTSAYLDWIEQRTGIKPDDETSDVKPTARFSTTVDGLSVTFNNNSTDDKGIVSHSWNFGDGNQSNALSPNHQFPQSGSFTVTLTVTDTSGQQDSTAQSITVTSDPCPDEGYSYVEWSASTVYQIGDRVRYQGKTYEATWWSVGAKPSLYTNVWKEVDGGNNNCPSENEAPTASFAFNTSELTVGFSNQSIDDKGIVSHLWNFGDGLSSTSINPSHTYANAGSYTVRLTVTDAEGLSGTISKVLTVAKSSGCNGLTEWNAMTSYSPGDKVSFNGAVYEATWWSTSAQPDIFSNVWSYLSSCN